MKQNGGVAEPWAGLYLFSSLLPRGSWPLLPALGQLPLAAPCSWGARAAASLSEGVDLSLTNGAHRGDLPPALLLPAELRAKAGVGGSPPSLSGQGVPALARAHAPQQ